MMSSAVSMILLFSALVLTLLGQLGRAEWVSDIGESSPEKGQKALAARAEKFWTAMLQAAEDVNLNEYEDLLNSADETLAKLPAENAEVVRLLQDSAKRLRRTSQALFLNAIAAGEQAGEKLSKGFMAKRPEVEVSISALGVDVFGQAIRRFAAAENIASGGEAFNEKALREVAERQGDVLPVLQQTADLSKDILEDCRQAKNHAFDALKYELYTKGAPATPQVARDLADKLIGAASFMRHKFFGLAMGEVSAIVHDTDGAQKDSAAKVLTSTSAPGAAASDHLPVLSI